MKTEFVTYEIALELKELGFDEPCLAFYWNTGKFYTTAEYPHSIETHKQNQLGDYNYDSTSAPLHAQAFRWFREKYGYSANIRRVGVFSFVYEIFTNDLGVIKSDLFGGHEKAELKCLKKLIEIVKDNK